MRKKHTIQRYISLEVTQMRLCMQPIWTRGSYSWESKRETTRNNKQSKQSKTASVHMCVSAMLYISHCQWKRIQNKKPQPAYTPIPNTNPIDIATDWDRSSCGTQWQRTKCASRGIGDGARRRVYGCALPQPQQRTVLTRIRAKHSSQYRLRVYVCILCAIDAFLHAPFAVVAYVIVMLAIHRRLKIMRNRDDDKALLHLYLLENTCAPPYPHAWPTFVCLLLSVGSACFSLLGGMYAGCTPMTIEKED